MSAKLPDFDQRQLKDQAEMASAEKAASDALLAKLQPFVQQLAADEGYAYVFDKT